MHDFLQLLITYENWIYLIFGISLLLYLRRFFVALAEWRSTIFGLEREQAQKRLNSSLAMSLILLMMIAAEFILVNFISPEWPQAQSAMQNATNEANDSSLASIVIVVTATPDGTDGGMIQNLSAVANVDTNGCTPDQLEWTSPAPSQNISGLFELTGTINVADMAFYTYSYSPLIDLQNWVSISAGNTPVVNGSLGLLATTEIPNGDYTLRMVAFDQLNNAFPSCNVSVRIMN